MAARDAVLNTCELLEHIISYLPPHQIAPASRVCKTWKTLIDDSAKISRARCCLVPIRESPRGPGRPYTVYARDSDILFHVGLGGGKTSAASASVRMAMAPVGSLCWNAANSASKSRESPTTSSDSMPASSSQARRYSRCM